MVLHSVFMFQRDVQTVEDSMTACRVIRMIDLLYRVSTTKHVSRLYGSSIISAHSDILFASRESDINKSVLRYLGEVTSSLATLDPCWAEFAPGIDGDCNLTLPLNAQDWSIHGFPIEYCLSRPVKEHCKLQLSVAIMIILVICNFTKAICMGLFTWKSNPEP